jgi:hypothetical protein
MLLVSYLSTGQCTIHVQYRMPGKKWDFSYFFWKKIKMSSYLFCKLSTFSESMNPVHFKMLKFVPNTDPKTQKGGLTHRVPRIWPPFWRLKIFWQ